MRAGRVLSALALSATGGVALGGCSTVGSSAVRTGALALPPHVGPVAVFAAGQPTNAAEVGVVEVHASQSEATVEELLPLFVRKVAQLGGNAAVIDAVVAHFQIVEHAHVETYSYPCGLYVCTGTRMFSANDEVIVVSMTGRAFALGLEAAASPSAAPPTPVPPPYVPTLPQARPKEEVP